VNIFDIPPSAANVTRHTPRLCRNPDIPPSSPTPETRISIQYFLSLFAIPEKLNSRIINNAQISIRYFCRLLPLSERIKPLIISNLDSEISIRYFWTPSARTRLAADNQPKSPNSTISGHIALIAPPFSIFSFQFSSSANMAP